MIISVHCCDIELDFKLCSKKQKYSAEYSWMVLCWLSRFMYSGQVKKERDIFDFKKISNSCLTFFFFFFPSSRSYIIFLFPNFSTFYLIYQTYSVCFFSHHDGEKDKNLIYSHPVYNFIYCYYLHYYIYYY